MAPRLSHAGPAACHPRLIEALDAHAASEWQRNPRSPAIVLVGEEQGLADQLNTFLLAAVLAIASRRRLEVIPSNTSYVHVGFKLPFDTSYHGEPWWHRQRTPNVPCSELSTRLSTALHTKPLKLQREPSEDHHREDATWAQLRHVRSERHAVVRGSCAMLEAERLVLDAALLNGVGGAAMAARARGDANGLAPRLDRSFELIFAASATTGMCARYSHALSMPCQYPASPLMPPSQLPIAL